jgi:sugar/nucleoside kinase (ribokinase family)
VSIGVAVVGSPFLDLVFEGLPRLPGPGEEVVGRELHVVPGGTAIQAIGLARLGMSVALVSPRAEDLPGRLLAEALEREGVRWVGRPTARTATTAVLSAIEGTAMATTTAGGGEPDLDGVAATGPERVVLSLGRAGLRPPGVPACIVTGSIEIEAGASLADVPQGASDVLVMNVREATSLTGEDDAADAARRLARHVDTAVVTLGADGAVGVRGGELAHAPAPSVPTVDATGAGDLFVAATVWATARDLALPSVLAWACLYASLSVSSPTALAGARRLHDLLEEGRDRGLTPP